MKRKIIFILLILFVAVLLANCNQYVPPARHVGAAAFYMQITPTPPAEDQSRIGSTNGIFVMGILIVFITTVPIFLHKKKK